MSLYKDFASFLTRAARDVLAGLGQVSPTAAYPLWGQMMRVGGDRNPSQAPWGSHC